jgi:hypothetical protein
MAMAVGMAVQMVRTIALDDAPRHSFRRAFSITRQFLQPGKNPALSTGGVPVLASGRISARNASGSTFRRAQINRDPCDGFPLIMGAAQYILPVSGPTEL